MNISVPDRAASYANIIRFYLTKTYTAEEYTQACQVDEDWGVPKMYATMLEALLSLVRDRNPSATREQIRELDVQASGHTDYQARLAIACADLSASYHPRHAHAVRRPRGLKI